MRTRITGRFGFIACAALMLALGSAALDFGNAKVQAADDDCPATQGFWRRVCTSPHPSGEFQKIPGYVTYVKTNAAFSKVRFREDICQQLHPDPADDKCAQAKAQFMAVLLNVASGRIKGTDKLVNGTSECKTVDGFIYYANKILSMKKPTFDQCVLVQSLADDINNAFLDGYFLRCFDGEFGS